MNVIMILCDTLRRDHCGPYHQSRPVNEAGSAQQPAWIVPTPAMDRLAARGTTFDQCWCGSTPCMPARRDIYTGRLEFLWRGWGAMEESDLDLPRQVSGPPNRSMFWSRQQGYKVSYLLTDHFHLWEQGSGNYHMGYSGFDFVRGAESDAYRTDPVAFDCSTTEREHKSERHYRNIQFIRQSESDWFAPQVLARAADWLQRNHTHGDFYLHLDCFTPAHEPWDPPESYVKMFDPRGYNVPDSPNFAPYEPWRGSDLHLRALRARYAAGIVLFDRWLGKLLDQLDALDLWKNSLVILTSDHGTFNGDHGRMGKLQTHQHAAVGHVPLIIAHPTLGHGERRQQLVQLVDLYPTTLASVGRPCPKDIHGVNLLPVLADAMASTRSYAMAGMFGKSVTLVSHDWILHQSPVEQNTPLYWYGYQPCDFLGVGLGPVENGRRLVTPPIPSWPTPTWLSNRRSDPNELVNLALCEPAILHQMQQHLRSTLMELNAPIEQLQRFALI